jgi:hypothetical protein
MEQGQDMFYLLRVAFWLTIVLALLPSGGAKQGAQANFDASDAVSAAGAAISDVSGFCDRQPEACEVGAQAAAVIGQRAQAGARMVYEFINDHASRGGEIGSVTVRKIAAVPASPGSQSTLKPSDLEPAWQGPPAQAESIPLPRPRRGHHPRKA